MRFHLDLQLLGNCLTWQASGMLHPPECLKEVDLEVLGSRGPLSTSPWHRCVPLTRHACTFRAWLYDLPFT